MEHKVIWLQPACCDGGHKYDREWSSTNEWPNGCEDCGEMPVKYILAPDQPTKSD